MPVQPRPALLVLLAIALTVLGAPTLARPQASEPAGGWSRFEQQLGSGLVLAATGGGDFEARGRLRVAPRVETALELDRATRRVLEAAAELLGAEPGALRETGRLELAGLHVVVHEQRVAGLPVVGSRVELRIGRDGMLTLLRARGLAARGLRTPLVVRSSEARELARLSLPDEDPAALWAGAARPIARRAADGMADGAYEVDVFDPARPAAAWVVTVDGASGLPLEVRTAVLEAITGTVDGRGITTGPQTTSTPAVLPLANLFVTGFDASSGLVRITTNACGDGEVALSADGSQLVWASDCDGDRELWSAASDGSGLLQLTSNADDDHAPVISADGTRIVFVSDRDGDEELFAIASDGTGLVQLTSNTGRDRNPSLSGDGARVVYQSDVDGDDEIFTLLVAAPVPTQLTFDAAADVLPRISLDGTRIAWTSHAEIDGEVWTMDSAGGAVTRITVNDVDDVDVAISPDGSRVAFAAPVAVLGEEAGDLSFTLTTTFIGTRARAGFRHRQHDLFQAAADASELVRLTADRADERAAAYAADGGCLAYTTDAGGDRELELLDLATFQVVHLTDDGTPDLAPSVGASCGTGAWIANDGDGEVFVWDMGLGLLAGDITTSTGAWSLDVPDGASPSVSTRLRGRWARVVDLDPRWGEERASASAVAPAGPIDLHLNPLGAEEGPTAQVTAYVHANRAHDALAAIMTRPPLSLTGPLPIDAQLELRANFPAPVPNAYYAIGEGRATFFVGAGLGRPNTAYDTLVLHEAGHFFDDLLGGLAPGSACEAYGALSEAWGDVVATFVSGSAVVGADFFGPGEAIRDYDLFPWDAPDGARGRQYGCEDCETVAGKPEVHDHGEAFAGFAWDLRLIVGAVTAEDLLVGALLTNPADMVDAVSEVFGLSATAAFGGSGDPATSPLYEEICSAAAAHGFDCPPRPDHAPYDCVFTLCGSTPAVHAVIGSEWLGTLVFPDTGCEPLPPSPVENDGVFMPATTWAGGLPIGLTATISVDPSLQDSGRYGAPLPETQIPERRVFLNAWLLIDNTMGGLIVVKVLGDGSGSGISGPDSFEPGVGEVAFNPDNFSGSSTIFPFTITPPTFAEPRLAVLRVRLDYGEDVGRLSSCTSHPSLSGPCGRARYGEVEEYQIAIVPPDV